jgi:U3 small nucleolar RNA-associated protein 10
VELVNAVQASEDHARFVNARLLGHMRAENYRVKLAAVETLTQIYAKTGEEWLSLLPESVPVIAELMEDDEEEVESATQRLIAAIEEHLGAGELENMLT